MNNLPMVLRLISGSSTPSSALQKVLGGIDVHQRNVVVAAKQRHHLFAFAEPQQPVVDEHASELIANRLVDENRGDGGIDAA